MDSDNFCKQVKDNHHGIKENSNSKQNIALPGRSKDQLLERDRASIDHHSSGGDSGLYEAALESKTRNGGEVPLELREEHCEAT